MIGKYRLISLTTGLTIVQAVYINAVVLIRYYFYNNSISGTFMAEAVHNRAATNNQ